ncbi:DEAD/DEAH box helicase family protein [Sphingomonas sp. G124]|uniref:DEAD/DEAH box helicase family protein n=1 Tax=Sphingomonas cremea TaxID=2904799 RepID=A0A9X1QLX9_9SPHN|nr:DEAD/DEAH box helicase family protein [Sphingomonas cremea]MCF2514542.1 DEAD/DEAH box helicase family protein [Sphingomonas cremea]
MKFTLKDYQDDAVREVLERLKRARKRWHDDGDKHAFSLSATTGSGKTVMAAAVIEALFFGNDDFDFEADPGAAVIWFSDDPSLNEQSKWRLQQASDKLTVSDLVTVESTFGRERFEAGKVYFLNTQKLGKNSLLVRGHDPSDASIEKDDRQVPIMPDMRSHTIWDTIRNTVEDPDLTLYLVLDEAHRGMRDGGLVTVTGRPTIVRQLINGTGSVPGIPVVWGISATVQRFNAAMEGMTGHDTLRPVIVDSKLVQDSGLIKDTVDLDYPKEVGDFATSLLKRATIKLSDISKAWATYAKQQHDVDTVLPLMVLQVPNSPDHNEIATWLDVVFETWPELSQDCIANVFGEHRTETFGKYSVPYIAPERVQESDWVRILLAKDAISTGWDCPRAEVMVSFRAATDKTHITQLLGRMVRTPLARRIPGNDRLNAVDCLLPRFNKDAVNAVVSTLMNGGEAGDDLPMRRVLINPIEVLPNSEIPAGVWNKLLSLPSQALPKKQARPAKRLTALAHELSVDGLLPGAGLKAHAEMHKVLDRAQARLADRIKEAREAVLTVEGSTLTANTQTQTKTFNDFVMKADYAVIEDAYKRAGRVISPDLARTYAEHLASQDKEAEDDDEALIDAHTTIAALGLIGSIKEELETAAEVLSKQWLAEYRESIRVLTDERQEAYREIREMSADPVDVDLARPNAWLQPTTAKEANGTEVALPRYERHLLCDPEGKFPDELNKWERAVLEAEMKLGDRVAWYRNPARASQESLGIVYDDDGESKIVRPDFVFFSATDGGGIVADIVDPHGHHLADALPKLRGLARYAAANGSVYRRIEAVSEIDGKYRMLDLTNDEVRDAIASAASAKSVYLGAMGRDYDG